MNVLPRRWRLWTEANRIELAWRLGTVTATLFAFALARCVAPAILTPPSGPGTPYPCGIGGTVCMGEDGGATGMCCGSDEVCGGAPFSGCAAGFCCYIGAGARSDASRDGGR